MAPAECPKCNPVPPAPNRSCGNRGLLFLGILLILAFLLPVFEEDSSDCWCEIRGGTPENKLKFISAETAFSGEAPIMARFMAVFPLLAGVTILLLARRAEILVRGIVVTGLGIILFLAELIGMAGEWGTLSLLPAHAGLLVSFLVWFGLTGLLAGSLIRRRHPQSRFAAITGIVGGLLFLVGLLLPVLPMGANLFAFLYRFFSEGEGMESLFGLIGLLGWIFWVVASLFCFFNLPKQAPDSAKTHANYAYWSFWTGAVLVCLFIVLALSEIRSGPPFAAQLLCFLKLGAWLVGGFLILPLGLAELALAAQERKRISERIEAPR